MTSDYPFLDTLKIWGLDTLERAVKTFGQVFGAQLISSGFLSVDHVTNLSMLQRCFLAGLSSGISVVTSSLSTLKGSPATASLISSIVPLGKNKGVIDLPAARAAVYDEWKAGTITWTQVEERLAALHES